MLNNSPGHRAGLIPGKDFVLTCVDFDYFDLDDFVSKVEEIANINYTLGIKLVVFNINSMDIRIVTIQRTEFDNELLLGIEFGIGALHSLKSILLEVEESIQEAEIEKLDSQEVYQQDSPVQPAPGENLK